jgi:hypothetical protein
MTRYSRWLAAVLLIIAIPAVADSPKVTNPNHMGMSSAKILILRNYFQKQASDLVEPGFQIFVSQRRRAIMHENIGYMARPYSTYNADSMGFPVIPSCFGSGIFGFP